MIFRRSLVRELTATGTGLFLVLLAILFTNLVLRLLAGAAGGSIAPEGIGALLGFNALFYLNILLSVALFLTVLLTLSRWYDVGHGGHTPTERSYSSRSAAR